MPSPKMEPNANRRFFAQPKHTVKANKGKFGANIRRKNTAVF